MTTQQTPVKKSRLQKAQERIVHLEGQTQSLQSELVTRENASKALLARERSQREAERTSIYNAGYEAARKDLGEDVASKSRDWLFVAGWSAIALLLGAALGVGLA